MKTIWRFLILTMLLFAGAAAVGTAASAEQTSALELRAVVEAEHSVAVTCGSGGQILLANGQPAGSSILAAHGEPLRVRIVPEQGQEIALVRYNGVDITDQVDAEGYVTLSPTLQGDGDLTVEFRPITSSESSAPGQSGAPGESSAPGSSESAPPTGDAGVLPAALLFGCVAVVLAVSAALRKQARSVSSK